jgi:cell division protein FtsL
MAVYEGTRYRPLARPAALPRRRQAARVRAGNRSNRVGVAMAAILVAFLLGLFYLTQTVRVAATNFDIDSLIQQRDDMTQQLQSLQGDIASLGAEVSVTHRAQSLGLNQLGAPLWVRGR